MTEVNVQILPALRELIARTMCEHEGWTVNAADLVISALLSAPAHTRADIARTLMPPGYEAPEEVRELRKLRDSFNAAFDGAVKVAEGVVRPHLTTAAVHGVLPDHRFRETARPADLVADIATALAARSAAEAVRAAAPLPEDIAALLRLREGLPPAPWFYRPWKHDDWGIVRAKAPEGSDLLGAPVANARSGRYDTEIELQRHRNENTDPYGPVAKAIANIHDMLDALERQAIEIEQIKTIAIPDALYPVALIQDRYQGCYSGGRWLAIANADQPYDDMMSRASWCLRDGPHCDDISASVFWDEPPAWIAAGATPADAAKALAARMDEERADFAVTITAVDTKDAKDAESSD